MHPSTLPIPPVIYLYTKYFKFSGLHKVVVDGVDVFAPAPNIDMFLLHRHLRANSMRMGDIIRLTDVCKVVELVPRFSARMDHAVDCDNCPETSDSFYLNNFADKETFHTILSYQ
jgi:hypothetical protein